ncbi:site-specific integrase [Luminiphilus sp.]|nr:site-specific integrase [Luminiphilus sp.]
MLYHCCTGLRYNVGTGGTLTQSKVDKLQPRDKRYLVKDTGGLSVCVQPTGAKSFQLRYRIHGRQKTLSFGNITLKDARAKAQAARVAIYEGDNPQTKALLRKEKQISFGAFVEQHYLPHLRAVGKNANETEKMLSAQFIWLWTKPIADMRLVEMKAWQNKQATDKTIATANRYTNAVKAVTEHARYLELVSNDPLADFHRLKEPDALQEIRWLTEKEEQVLRATLSSRDFSRHGIEITDTKLTKSGNVTSISLTHSGSIQDAIKNAKTRWFKDHLTPAVLLMLDCGLRRQEALRLRWSDIRPTTQEGEYQLLVNPSSEKMKRGRYVPLLKETLTTLLAWQEDQQLKGVSSEFLFPHPATGKPLGSVDTAWENLITEASRRCKSLQGLTVKNLRSTYGSRLVQNGAPIFTVSKLLGHSSVTVTEKHYAALSDEGKREAVNTLSKMPKEMKLRLLKAVDTNTS